MKCAFSLALLIISGYYTHWTAIWTACLALLSLEQNPFQEKSVYSAFVFAMHPISSLSTPKTQDVVYCNTD